MSTHVLIGMMPDAEFYVTCCDSVQTAWSDPLGIVGFVLDCPPGHTYTVVVWLADTGIDINWWLDMARWPLVWFVPWW